MTDFVLVPREPTEAMIAITDERNPPFGTPESLTAEFCERWRNRHRKAYREIYMAMLAAAPPPPNASPAGEVVAWRAVRDCDGRRLVMGWYDGDYRPGLRAGFVDDGFTIEYAYSSKGLLP
jgi:hypothetical protein